MVLVLVKGWYCLGCLEQERIALLQLKANINYPNGTSLPSWVEGENVNCCKWVRVECNSITGYVIQLSLNHTRDYDILKSWYFNASLFLPFKELKTLFLSGNHLAGWVENEGFERLSTLKNLEVLDLSRNEFNNSVLSSLSGLSHLKYLDLGLNDLKGLDHFNKLDDFISLKELDLSDNYIEVFEPIQGLEILRLSVNYLNNSILASLRGFSTLKYLDLSSNLLTGSLHVQELDAFRNLEELDLSYNEIESFVNPEGVKSLEQLKVLHLNSINNPSNLTKSLMALSSSLKTLYFTDKQLTGEFRTEGWCELKNLQELDIHRNQLKGILPPCLGNLTYLRVFDVSDNQLTGNIALSPLNILKSLEYLSLSSNDFQVPVSFKSFANHSNLKVILCHSNTLTGENDSYTWAPKFQLRAFVLSSRNRDNSIAAIPNFLYYQYDLRFIDLSHTKLSGMFPTWLLENNTSLEGIHLSDNSLVGTLKLPPHHYPNLLDIDVSNNKIGDNKFNGNIPSQLCQCQQLTILDLSQNNLSGSLPPCLGNTFPSEVIIPDSFDYGFSIPELQVTNHHMGVSEHQVLVQLFEKEEVDFTTKRQVYSYKDSILRLMSGIDLSCNQITGEIPSEIGSLSNIHVLNLSHNNFTGPIPTTFSNLRQIESLDLSYNNLNGQIPSQLSALNFLAVFSVAYNNLSGRIPNQKGQFWTFNESSYEGNPLLCGPPLQNNFNEIGKQSPKPNASSHEVAEDGFIDMGAFYGSFVGSYVTVLLGILVVLCINPRWRRAWFYLIEVCITESYYFVIDNFFKLFKCRNL
ncbi:receptor like protein 45 [Actinidia rufa]|uniref:Receptor like protein 45 n=1 Tax=Actinidia rufa TaxID=165716 RepID=A0A7J0EGY0_9ERIC|nr:receptor like protein 45 [Actinidia rufa]